MQETLCFLPASLLHESVTQRPDQWVKKIYILGGFGGGVAYSTGVSQLKLPCGGSLRYGGAAFVSPIAISWATKFPPQERNLRILGSSLQKVVSFPTNAQSNQHIQIQPPFIETMSTTYMP